MDSLTQIILGAAVAEASLGKKIGNRAMVWGAIAGTIPDLDVISNLFLSPLGSLVFHRGMTHSFGFCIVMALLLGYVIPKMYAQKKAAYFGLIGWSILILGLEYLILSSGFSIQKLGIGLVIGLGSVYLLKQRYMTTAYKAPIASVREWQWMFFWALITHPILDCFTTYGTQFLWPFSHMRISFNNIAVADPGYTVPFLICLIVACCLRKGSKQRINWNIAGLVISSVYMLWTIYNKTVINSIFTESLQKEGYTYDRYMTTPSILNNILWSGIAENDTAFIYGQYSFFDKERRFKLAVQPKSDAAFGESLQKDETLKTLRWFSNDYYYMKDMKNDTIKYFDLRFGSFRMSDQDADQFVFAFNLSKDANNVYTLLDQGETPKDGEIAKVFKVLMDRVLGKIGQ